MTVHTNRDVKDGWLQFDGANGTTVTHGETLPGDPQAFAVRLTLDESSQYRICFTSAEGENFIGSAVVPADRRAGQAAGRDADAAGGAERQTGLGPAACRRTACCSWKAS